MKFGKNGQKIAPPKKYLDIALNKKFQFLGAMEKRWQCSKPRKILKFKFTIIQWKANYEDLYTRQPKKSLRIKNRNTLHAIPTIIGIRYFYLLNYDQAIEGPYQKALELKTLLFQLAKTIGKCYGIKKKSYRPMPPLFIR